MARYSKSFEAWWNENKNSDPLQDDYKNYRLDVSYTDEKPLSFKRWAFNNFTED
jgi:hypothetical protein